MSKNAIHVALSTGRTISLHLFDQGILFPVMTQLFPFSIKRMRSFFLQSPNSMSNLILRLS